MASAWETAQANQVIVGILHTEITSMAWSFGFRNLIIPGPPPIPLAGMPFDHARNVACQAAINAGVEWIFFLDSDVVPPKDAILRLISYRQPIMSGVYHRRSPPHGVPVMIKGPTWYVVPPNSGIVEVDLVGAGCLLIHRSVLERFMINPLDAGRGKTVFDWRVDMAGILPQGEALSEDFSFCLHARKMGYKILVDTGIQCRHGGMGQAEFGSFKPLEVLNVT